MANVKKYDFSGKEVGTLQVDDEVLGVKVNSQLIKDYIVAIRNNARQWSAHTKGRSEVNKTGRKPHPQKGQGRSRQGCLAAPHYKGGGIVGGPRAKFDQHVRINRKERRAAIRFLIAEMIREDKVRILSQPEMKEPKTAKVAGLLDGWSLGRSRVLVLGGAPALEMRDEGQQFFARSLRNIPKKEFVLIPNVNGYEIAVAHELVVLESAVPELLSMLGQSV
jgi:large subunit ribosomal protein L4